MKRFTQIMLFLILVSTLFANTKPSLDGRAVVADEGVLPRGLFAKTVGYLPGDSVSVTNPATGVTINVLVLGSLDPSSGVAILLSPEAADKLFITQNTNSQVKITKRSGQLDETALGSAVLESDPDKDSEASIPDSLKNSLEEKMSMAEVAVAEPIIPLEEEVAVAEPIIPLEEEVAVAETIIPLEEVAVTEPIIPLEEEIAVAETIIPLEEEVAVTEPIIPLEEEIAVAETIIPLEEEVAVTETIIPLEEEVAVAEPIIPLEEEVAVAEPIIPLEEEVAVAETIIPLEEEVAVAETIIPLEEEVAVAEPIIPLEEEVAVAETIIPLEEEVAVAETIIPLEEEVAVAEEDPSLVDPFAPIILIPTDENPPEIASNEVGSSTIEPVPVVPVPEKTNSTVQIISTTPTYSENYESHIVDSLSMLQSGKYYVQIATLAEKDNINSIISEYSTKYPIVMVPLKSGTAYQIMIGPLSMDEYGSVMAKFKAYGFSDAFLRKIR